VHYGLGLFAIRAEPANVNKCSWNVYATMTASDLQKYCVGKSAVRLQYDISVQPPGSGWYELGAGSQHQFTCGQTQQVLTTLVDYDWNWWKGGGNYVARFYFRNLNGSYPTTQTYSFNVPSYCKPNSGEMPGYPNCPIGVPVTQTCNCRGALLGGGVGSICPASGVVFPTPPYAPNPTNAPIQPSVAPTTTPKTCTKDAECGNCEFCIRIRLR
jgi:hypothetical protein